MKPELSHLCKRKCDKQLDRNSVSLFIDIVCGLQANRLKNLFSGFDNPCKKFLWGNENDS